MSEVTTTVKRSSLLTMGKEAIDKIKAVFQVKKDKKTLEVAILNYEESIAEADLSIQNEKGSPNFNVSTILDAIDNKAITERKLAQAKGLLEELF